MILTFTSSYSRTRLPDSTANSTIAGATTVSQIIWSERINFIHRCKPQSNVVIHLFNNNYSYSYIITNSHRFLEAGITLYCSSYSHIRCWDSMLCWWLLNVRDNNLATFDSSKKIFCFLSKLTQMGLIVFTNLHGCWSFPLNNIAVAQFSIWIIMVRTTCPSLLLMLCN